MLQGGVTEERCIAVVGCGRMGRGIACLAAQHGVRVLAVPGRAGGRERSIAAFEADRVRAVRRDPGLSDSFELIEVVEDASAASECDVWIESVSEDLETKRAVFQMIESHASASALLATNSSSLPLEDISSALKSPDRFLALHFFNPPTRMKLVEVGISAQSSEEALQAARELCEALGQTAIEVRATPGYVVNRLLVPQLLHAIETLQDGVATAPAIDDAMTLGLSHAMGPLALADYIGLDVVLAMAVTMRRELDDPRFDPPALLRRLVDAGDLGRKTGLGFYVYGGNERSPNLALP